MTDDDLKPLVDACERYVLRHGQNGVTRSFIGGTCRELRLLDHDDNTRLQVLLCKRPSIGTSVGRNGGLRFHPYHLAPRESLNIRHPRSLADVVRPLLQPEPEGAVLLRAADLT